MTDWIDTVSAEEYDQIINQIADLELQIDDWMNADSPRQKTKRADESTNGRIVKTKEAARILGVPEYTIREAVKRGKLKPANSRRDGKRRHFMFDRNDLEKEKLTL